MCKSLMIPAALVAAFALAGCASIPGLGGYAYNGYSTRPYPNSAGVYTPDESQQIQHVETGTVIAVQHVSINAGTSHKMLGEGIGAVTGGLLGRHVGGSSGKTLATVAGAIGGAVAGDAVAGHGYRQAGLQVTIKLDGRGGTIAVTQQTGPTFHIGERVEVIGGRSYNHPARVEPLGVSRAVM